MTYWVFATRDQDVRFVSAPWRSFIDGAARSLVQQGWNVRTGIAQTISLSYNP